MSDYQRENSLKQNIIVDYEMEIEEDGQSPLLIKEPLENL